MFFFFKQKTAYEMRISDWSSDVCSSDLLGERRIKRVAQSLSGQRFQEVFKTSVRATAEPSAFGAYLRSAVLHSLAVRLKESFVQVGRGDERQVVMHVQLPIQFSQAGDPVITVCEVGAFGDGTTRSFVERFERSEGR